MKKRLLALLLILHTLSSVAQQPFNIEGTISDSLNGQHLYLYSIDYSNLNKPIRDSVVIAGGRFHFSGQLVTPAVLVSIYLKNSRVFFDQFFVQARQMQVNITQGPSGRPIAQVENSPATRQYREWKEQASQPFVQKYPIMMKIDSLRKAGANAQLIRTEEERLPAIQAAQKQAQYQYVRQHSKEYMALYALRYFLTGDDNPYDTLQPLYQQLSPELKLLTEARAFEKELAAMNAISVGKPAPLFSATAPDGTTVSLATFKGRYVLLDFWASWCGPCLQQAPGLKAAYEKYRSKGLAIVGISLDDNRDKWIAAIQQHELNWPHLSELKGFKGTISAAYSVSAIPTTFLLDKNGIILAIDPHLSSLETFLK
ncbi:AhpC/TSA family protein [Chitinophaga horti]|uniref:AhpC/TSA family protein n=1 Tax=Chitinophaga horti TaxID=2920382 RepID=A0ABY6IYB6_9BACT|nr:TlpA disulfide reductase family protein [Chitinophaga horti]UYQ92375.1 AhpC/TSA family protein [Chitinophaga horti]